MNAKRIIVIDDNPSIHEDFKKVLMSEDSAPEELLTLSTSIFGGSKSVRKKTPYNIEFAHRGQDGARKVQEALNHNAAFELAFVDMRMPNGWNGLETIKKIWEYQPDLQVVLCTAYSDFSWDEIQEELGHSDRFFVLKKPFDNIEVQQLAEALISRHTAEKIIRENEIFVSSEKNAASTNGYTLGMTNLISKIADLSHRAGMAEVANSVLHNIGNVLNSVNVSVSVIRQQLKSTPLNKLPPMVELLKQNESDLSTFLTSDEKGKLFPRFLEMLSEQWQAEHATLIAESNQLRDSVQHINDIISKQQSLSGQLGVHEIFNVAELIRSTFSFHETSFTRANIQIIFDLEDKLLWNGDRSKFTQIMLNLIVNAEESLVASSTSPHQLQISSHRCPDGHLEIKVQDNGCGISQEIMHKLFSYGFTTKPTGHGFGLHASALAAQDMGGTLQAFSDGIGMGATFVLSVPPSNATPAASSQGLSA